MKLNKVFASMVPFLFANMVNESEDIYKPLTKFNNGQVSQSVYRNSNGKSRKGKTNMLHVSKKTRLKHKKTAKN